MGRGLAIAGFVLSIVGVVFGILNGWFSIIGLPVAIVGLVLSVNGRRRLSSNGMPTGIGTAGLVLGIIATVFTAIAFFTCGICLLCAAGTIAGIENSLSGL